MTTPCQCAPYALHAEDYTMSSTCMKLQAAIQPNRTGELGHKLRSGDQSTGARFRRCTWLCQCMGSKPSPENLPHVAPPPTACSGPGLVLPAAQRVRPLGPPGQAGAGGRLHRWVRRRWPGLSPGGRPGCRLGCSSVLLKPTHSGVGWAPEVAQPCGTPTLSPFLPNLLPPSTSLMIAHSAPDLTPATKST